VELDDLVCYCHHVSLRKLVNFARRERPDPPCRMSECLGAGTGCGWCIPYLIKIAASADDEGLPLLDLTPAEYAEARRRYRRDGNREGSRSEPDERG
jgi:bacterioferritin-associated ferredoxin